MARITFIIVDTIFLSLLDFLGPLLILGLFRLMILGLEVSYHISWIMLMIPHLEGSSQLD